MRYPAREMLMGGFLDAVWSAIPYGRENAINAETLSKVLNVNSRDIRSAIEMLAIEHGLIVIGDNYGYYKPSCLDEIWSFNLIFEGRVRTSQQRAKAIHDFCENYTDGLMQAETVKKVNA